MSLTIHCPSCQVELIVPDSAGGRRLKCPKCSTKFHAPAPKAVATPHASAKRSESPSPKKTKVPPSSGVVPSSRRSEEDLPFFTGDLRDLDALPLLGEVKPPSRHSSSIPPVADVAALFADDEPTPPSRRPSAEKRKHPRQCPDCGGMVPAGMSLCNGCGLDLDTGQRMELELEEEVDETPLVEIPSGPPASILVIGLGTMMAFGALAVFSFLKLDILSGTALGLISLFGVLASILFAAGKSVKVMTIALMLGALTDILTMIAVPVIVANTFDEVVEPEPASAETILAPTKPEAEDDKSPVEPPPLLERLDMTKMTWGVIILLIDAILLAYINSPPIRKHFARRHHVEEEGPLMI